MTSRREFLQIGISAGAWPLAATARAASAAAGDVERVQLYKVVYDTRFRDSVSFGRRMEALRLPVHAIAGDVTAFWYEELYHQWRREPAAIAGLTAHGPLFCLERLAWDQGMRVVFRAEHKPAADGCLEHDLSGPLAMLQRSLSLTDAGPGWSTRIADVVAQCPRGRSEISTTRLTAPASFEPSVDHDEPLYSWVIAPATRA